MVFLFSFVAVRSCIERKETEEALLGQLLELNKEYKILVCRELMLENKERADSELKKEFEENKTEVEVDCWYFSFLYLVT